MNNELMIKENELNLESEGNRQKFTTIDMSTTEGKAKIYNSLQSCDIKLIDIKGQDIEVEDILIEARTINETDEKTGEIKENRKYRTILYGTNGMTYVSTAYGVFNSLRQIVSIFGNPSKENPYKLKVTGRQNKNGRESLILSYIYE